MIGLVKIDRWKRIRDVIAAAEQAARPLTRDEFGELLRDARVLAGMSLGDLADKLGTTPAKLSGVEMGSRMDRLRERVARGECTDCGVKTTSVRQAGSCVYAEPCGHRIGQGDARKVAEHLGVEVTS